MLSTYPPTQCGLATFSAALSRNLAAAGASVKVVRVVDRASSSAHESQDELVNGSPLSRDASVKLLNQTQSPAGIGCSGHELRPPVTFFGQICHGDGFAMGIAVKARPFFGLQLEQLQPAGPFRSSGHQVETLPRVGQQQASCFHVEELRALFGEAGEELDHVEVFKKRRRPERRPRPAGLFPWGFRSYDVPSYRVPRHRRECISRVPIAGGARRCRERPRSRCGRWRRHAPGAERGRWAQ